MKAENSNKIAANIQYDGNQHRRKDAIIDAAIKVLAQEGYYGLTHRKVAKLADVSLGTSTYYFHSKFDILEQASRKVLEHYKLRLRFAIDKISLKDRTPIYFQNLLKKLIVNSFEKDREYALCFLETVIEARRNKGASNIYNEWFSSFHELWFEIATICNVPSPENIAQSAIDLAIGIMVIGFGLNVKSDSMNGLLANRFNKSEAISETCYEDEPPELSPKNSVKSHATREKIIDAAIKVLLEDGAGAINYKSICKHSGLAAAAPFYHFNRIENIITEAHFKLYEESKKRYRQITLLEQNDADYYQKLIDRTAAIFIREATEFSNQSICALSLYLVAARNIKISSAITKAVSEQNSAWDKALSCSGTETNLSRALNAQAIFIGKLIRIVATGSKIDDLAKIKNEFQFDLKHSPIITSN